MDKFQVAKAITLETLAWSPTDLCVDEDADKNRYYELLQLAALISDEKLAGEVILAELKRRIHELACEKHDELVEAH